MKLVCTTRRVLQFSAVVALREASTHVKSLRTTQRCGVGAEFLEIYGIRSGSLLFDLPPKKVLKK